MNGEAGRKTRERLKHALSRLSSEPRATDRRGGDRRHKMELMPPGFIERRLQQRRSRERRAAAQGD